MQYCEQEGKSTSAPRRAQVAVAPDQHDYQCAEFLSIQIKHLMTMPLAQLIHRVVILARRHCPFGPQLLLRPLNLRAQRTRQSEVFPDELLTGFAGSLCAAFLRR